LQIAYKEKAAENSAAFFFCGRAMGYILYGARGAGSLSVEAALAETGALFEVVDLDFKNNEQLSLAHRARNPTGKVPALILPSGGMLTESLAILLTIAERHPEAKLLPQTGNDARAHALQWMAFLSSEIYPMIEIEDYPERFAPGDAASSLREAARERVRERCLILERGISGDPWLLPSGFCAADIYAANLTRWIMDRDWRAANCPKIERLAAQVAARERIAPVWKRHFG
jgi:glutathione S-transferase